ncbi:hypothetical protein JCM8097_005834 [Rhodosporidiobolus ruineniae]
MVSLVNSVLEIIKGFLHAYFALWETAFKLVRAFVNESAALSTETVSFFFRHAIVLGVLGTLIVGYNLYQRNTARVKSRAHGAAVAGQKKRA